MDISGIALFIYQYQNDFNGLCNDVFHPRDFDPEQPMLKQLPLKRKIMSYYGLKSSLPKLDKLLSDHSFVDVEKQTKKLWENTAACSFVISGNQWLKRRVGEINFKLKQILYIWRNIQEINFISLFMKLESRNFDVLIVLKLTAFFSQEYLFTLNRDANTRIGSIRNADTSGLHTSILPYAFPELNQLANIDSTSRLHLLD